jgi:hypothetical protein
MLMSILFKSLLYLLIFFSYFMNFIAMLLGTYIWIIILSLFETRSCYVARLSLNLWSFYANNSYFFIKGFNQ